LQEDAILGEGGESKKGFTKKLLIRILGTINFGKRGHLLHPLKKERATTDYYTSSGKRLLKPEKKKISTVLGRRKPTPEKTLFHQKRCLPRPCREEKKKRGGNRKTLLLVVRERKDDRLGGGHRRARQEKKSHARLDGPRDQTDEHAVSKEKKMVARGKKGKREGAAFTSSAWWRLIEGKRRARNFLRGRCLSTVRRRKSFPRPHPRTRPVSGHRKRKRVP